ncbi:hypothetical protein [Rhodococcus erythropolis]|uniref:hypothetical protein n=1 Tax=Rhodococcus erythropolis TaxID=1833 RepID=UPI0030133785
MPRLLLLDFCIAAMYLGGLGFADDDPTSGFKVASKILLHKEILKTPVKQDTKAVPTSRPARDAGPIAPNANTTNTDNVTARAAPLG